MTPSDRITWINNASYYDLLRLWRKAPPGSKWFAGDVGEHYESVMRKRRDELDHDDRVRISKEVGHAGSE